MPDSVQERNESDDTFLIILLAASLVALALALRAYRRTSDLLAVEKISHENSTKEFAQKQADYRYHINRLNEIYESDTQYLRERLTYSEEALRDSQDENAQLRKKVKLTEDTYAAAEASKQLLDDAKMQLRAAETEERDIQDHIIALRIEEAELAKKVEAMHAGIIQAQKPVEIQSFRGIRPVAASI